MALKSFYKTALSSLITVFFLYLVNYAAGLTLTSSSFLLSSATAFMLIWGLFWKIGISASLIAVVIGGMFNKRKAVRIGGVFFLFIALAFIISLMLGQWGYYLKMGAIKGSSKIPVSKIKNSVLINLPDTKKAETLVHYTDLDLNFPEWAGDLKSHSVWYYNSSGNKAVQIFYGNRTIGKFSYIIISENSDIGKVYPYSDDYYDQIAEDFYLTSAEYKGPLWLFEPEN
ncbi:hypothetical protein L21SP3_02282 [Sedimentisphaera cyanobacteriorum]|uniref:Uncharacterized protein n=1 Tax=Sedimentisphaera cyanobacteriorum TaxID=1940790 RepID=A0A1Q2HSU5_9BACT|nr:hypothetical protein [Sedimentisphaera cyanobacteriorum]AQQ10450.1 hypothetical protein L21SP3_02282 [Sedimentisphaera cyanobacteriorum]